MEYPDANTVLMMHFVLCAVCVATPTYMSFKLGQKWWWAVLVGTLLAYPRGMADVAEYLIFGAGPIIDYGERSVAWLSDAPTRLESLFSALTFGIVVFHFYLWVTDEPQQDDVQRN